MGNERILSSSPVSICWVKHQFGFDSETMVFDLRVFERSISCLLLSIIGKNATVKVTIAMTSVDL